MGSTIAKFSVSALMFDYILTGPISGVSAGLYLTGLPEPRPGLTLEVHAPAGEQHVFYLGPHAPRLTSREIDLLHRLWLDVSADLAPAEIHHHDVVHFALEQLGKDLIPARRHEAIAGLQHHLQTIKNP